MPQRAEWMRQRAEWMLQRADGCLNVLNRCLNVLNGCLNVLSGCFNVLNGCLNALNGWFNVLEWIPRSAEAITQRARQGRATGTIVLASVIALSPLPAHGQTQTLLEIARRNGGSATGVISVDEPISRPADLMSLADLVVHGRVTTVTTRLDADRLNVVTEYAIAPIQAFKQRQPDSVTTPGTTSKIVAQHVGGSLTTADGLRLSTDVNIFPESETFRACEEVLLFLLYHPDTRIYTFVSQFGAYRIRNGVAALMTAAAAKNRGDQPIASSALFAELLRKQ